MTACMIKSKSGGAVVALLCLSVFLLVLSARLSVYESTHRSHGTNHQVLISDQKMEVGSFESYVPPLLLAVILFVLWSWPKVLWAARRTEPPMQHPPSTFERHRFLRPPPAL